MHAKEGPVKISYSVMGCVSSILSQNKEVLLTLGGIGIGVVLRKLSPGRSLTTPLKVDGVGVSLCLLVCGVVIADTSSSC